MLLVFLLFACSVHRIASVSPVNDHPLSEQELLVFKIELTRQRTMINRLLDRPFADKCDIDSFLMEALFDQPITDSAEKFLVGTGQGGVTGRLVGLSATSSVDSVWITARPPPDARRAS